MKTILITGINGFLGSSLAIALSKHYNIIGLEYSIENKVRLNNFDCKTYLVKDGIQDSLFSENNIDIVVHTATFYGKNNEDYRILFDANLFSSFNLLDSLIKHGCPLFINTDTILDRFVNAYSLTKRQFQEWLYFRKDEIKVINMQLEHFYGNGASKTNFITSMIDKLKNNVPKIDLTLGEQMRDFVYIEDVIDAFCLIIEKQDLITEQYSLFQVCSNELISIKELMLLLKDLTKSNSSLNFGALSYRANELMCSLTNNTELLSLGWKTKFSLREGLTHMITND